MERQTDAAGHHNNLSLNTAETSHHYISPEAAGADTPTAHLSLDFSLFPFPSLDLWWKKHHSSSSKPSFILIIHQFSLLYGYVIVLNSKAFYLQMFFYPGGQDVLSIDGCNCFI